MPCRTARLFGYAHARLLVTFVYVYTLRTFTAFTFSYTHTRCWFWLPDPFTVLHVTFVWLLHVRLVPFCYVPVGFTVYTLRSLFWLFTFVGCWLHARFAFTLRVWLPFTFARYTRYVTRTRWLRGFTLPFALYTVWFGYILRSHVTRFAVYLQFSYPSYSWFTTLPLLARFPSCPVGSRTVALRAHARVTHASSRVTPVYPQLPRCATCYRRYAQLRSFPVVTHFAFPVHVYPTHALPAAPVHLPYLAAVHSFAVPRYLPHRAALPLLPGVRLRFTLPHVYYRLPQLFLRLPLPYPVPLRVPVCARVAPCSAFELPRARVCPLYHLFTFTALPTLPRFSCCSRAVTYPVPPRVLPGSGSVLPLQLRLPRWFRYLWFQFRCHSCSCARTPLPPFVSCAPVARCALRGCFQLVCCYTALPRLPTVPPATADYARLPRCVCVLPFGFTQLRFSCLHVVVVVRVLHTRAHAFTFDVRWLFTVGSTFVTLV